MRLSLLLRLQLVYASLGVSFNVVSITAGVLGAEPLTSTNPYLGMATMLAYGSFLLAAYKGHLLPYRFLMVWSLVAFGHFGIYVHIVQLDRQPELYYSTNVAVAAIAINVYGWVLNLFAALGNYCVEERAS